MLIFIGRGPPFPPILRHGAIYCAIVTQTPPMSALFEGLRALRALAQPDAPEDKQDACELLR